MSDPYQAQYDRTPMTYLPLPVPMEARRWVAYWREGVQEWTPWEMTDWQPVVGVWIADHETIPSYIVATGETIAYTDVVPWHTPSDGNMSPSDFAEEPDGGPVLEGPWNLRSWMPRTYDDGSIEHWYWHG